MHLIASAVRGLAIALPLGLMIAAGTLTAAAAPNPNQPPGDPQNVQKLMGMLSGGIRPRYLSVDSHGLAGSAGQGGVPSEQ